MASISRAEALALFAYEEPTIASASRLFGNEFQELKASQSLQMPLAMPGIEYVAFPIVWAVFGSPEVRSVWVDNVTTWIGQNLFTAVSDVPPNLVSEKQEFKQLAALLNVDGAAGPLESTRFDTLDALLLAEVQMIYAAVMKNALAYTPITGSFTTLRAHASGHTVTAGGDRISFRLLMCLVQELNYNEARREQFSIVLSFSAYAQFVEMMSSAGMNTMRHDPVTGRDHWHFDGIRVVQSAYMTETGVDKAWGLLIRAPSAVLPSEMQASLGPAAKPGVVFGTARAGAEVTAHVDDGAPDRWQRTIQVTAGVFVPSPDTVAVLEDVCTG